MTNETEVNKLLNTLHQLPVIPVVVQEVISSFNDPYLDSTALAHSIEQDQGLAAKVLRVANSSFYGLPRTVGSMHEAVIVLGINHVRSLVLSAGFVKAFLVQGKSGFDRHAHWKRSFRVAVYAKALAKNLKYDQDMAFTAGMFHDIGQLVLDTCLQEKFASVLAIQSQTDGDLFETERAIIGFDHALIGAEVAKRWNFPFFIEHAIRYWHMPEQTPFEPVTGIVHVATLIESGLRGNALISRVPQSVLDQLDFNWANIEADLPDAEQMDAGASLLLSSS